ncbi:Polycystic kidney disease protein 1-like 2 [Nymphon striatum]|nr:Polycystic kidney disease protein 1-like 2 [Nymphon striatum]
MLLILAKCKYHRMQFKLIFEATCRLCDKQNTKFPQVGNKMYERRGNSMYETSIHSISFCNDVHIELPLQPLAGESYPIKINDGDEARLDVRAQGLWPSFFFVIIIVSVFFSLISMPYSLLAELTVRTTTKEFTINVTDDFTLTCHELRILKFPNFPNSVYRDVSLSPIFLDSHTVNFSTFRHFSTFQTFSKEVIRRIRAFEGWCYRRSPTLDTGKGLNLHKFKMVASPKLLFISTIFSKPAPTKFLLTNSEVGQKVTDFGGCLKLDTPSRWAKTAHERSRYLIHQLFRIASGAPAPPGICEDIMDAETKGGKSKVVFSTDMYKDDSIKSMERRSRGCGEKRIIQGENTRRPENWKEFLSNDDNKQQLIALLLKIWSSPECSRKLQKRKLSPYGETDTRVVLYCSFAEQEKDQFVRVRSPDSDIFFILLYYASNFNIRILFDTGSGNRRRLLDFNSRRSVQFQATPEIGNLLTSGDLLINLICIKLSSKCRGDTKTHFEGKEELRAIQKQLKTVLQKDRVAYKIKIEKNFTENNMKQIWKGMRLMSGHSNGNLNHPLANVLTNSVIARSGRMRVLPSFTKLVYFLSCVVFNCFYIYNIGTTPMLTFDQPLYWKAKTIIVHEKEGSELKPIVLNLDMFCQLNSGLFVIRRSDRLWAGLPSDLVIEQVLMRFLKTNGGLTPLSRCPKIGDILYVHQRDLMNKLKPKNVVSGDLMELMTNVTPSLRKEQRFVHQKSVIEGGDYFFFAISPEAKTDQFVILCTEKQHPRIRATQNCAATGKIGLAFVAACNNFRGTSCNNVSGGKSDVTLFASNSTTIYCGIAETRDYINLNDSKQLENLEKEDLLSVVDSFMILTSKTICSYFNEELQSWEVDGMKPKSVEFDTLTCCSNHLTTFGSGFFVMPNTIDFDYVFENASIVDNLTIYVTVIVSFALYLLLLVYTRRKDNKDLEKLGATPVTDNKPEYKYLYEILVFTGTKSNSETDSKISFVLSGDIDDTGVRSLVDKERPIFRRSSIDSFILSTPRPLGLLKYFRIWHDNSGKGKTASWYLDFIVVRDVQTGKKYEFIAHKWFGVEYDDGAIDRMLPVSGKDEVANFSHLFSTTSNRNLRDGHLWLSIFLRPPRSRFTRAQRLSSCMALLYLSMLVNIMWYGSTPSKPTSGLKVGPFSLSPAEIGVGVMSNIIVFVPSLIIITLFRKSRPRKLRPSRITEALKKQTKKIQKKKKFTFPWWCIIIAWMLTIACILVSLFFLWAYGITTLCSIFLTQPLKVVLLALVFSMVCKNLDQDEDDADEDEEDPCLADDEEWLHAEMNTRRKRPPKLLNTAEMQSLREKREKELEMYSIAKEVFAYLMFLWILLTLSYGNRDPSAIHLRQTLFNIFLKPGDSNIDYYKFVRNETKLYEWIKEAFLPELIVQEWYNGAPPNTLGGFSEDRTNFIIGVPILRQVRVKENTCTVHPVVWPVTEHCSGYGHLINEQEVDFREGWSDNKKAYPQYEFQYQPAEKLKSLPFWGILDWYGGGGYVYPISHPLRGKLNYLRKDMDRLMKSNWIDKSTRALFVEFGIYNAQVNLFSTVTIVAEFLPGGGIIPYDRIDVFRLQRYHTGFGLFILVCEVTFMLFVIYYTVHELKKCCKQKRNYLKSPVNLLGFAIVTISWSAFVMFVQREYLTYGILDVFRKTNGTGYIRLQHVAAVDEVLGYLVAFLVFLGNLKFLNLLRFNKRLGILSATLKECAAELSSFGVCLLIVFLAFVQLFYLILGLHMADYASFITAVESTFSMMLGKFKFHSIMMVSPYLGPLVFFIFGLATSLVLINILLTIVIQTFEEVKRDFTKLPNDYEMVEFIFNRIRSVMGMQLKRKVAPVAATEKKPTNRIEDLPKKVDKLISYINTMYLKKGDGYSKGLLKKKRNKKPEILESNY